MSTLLLLGCTVCYGDPASPLTKGAAAGVLVLGIAIALVAATFGGLFLFWMKRARALEAQLAMSPTTATAVLPPGEPLRSSPPSEPPTLTLH